MPPKLQETDAMKVTTAITFILWLYHIFLFYKHYGWAATYNLTLVLLGFWNLTHH